MHHLITKISLMEDPRTGNAKIHKLTDIVFMVIASVVAGMSTWDEIQEFASHHTEYFSKYLEMPGGVPSADTFARVFRMLSREGFEGMFRELVEEFRQRREKETGEEAAERNISIDGKTICGAGKYGKEYNVHVVSAYESESGLVLGQTRVEEKSNEVTAIPKLIDSLELKGNTISIDAMGCQKDIARRIIEKGAHYVLAVKKNQGRLLEDIEDTAKLEKPDSIYTETSGEHGRVETRTYELYHELSHISGAWNWEGLAAVVRVSKESWEKKSGKRTREQRFYIVSNRHASAQQIAGSIRSHWGIENSLHWVLDVVFNEDQGRKRKGNSAENFSRVLRFALVLIKQYKARHEGLKVPLQRLRLRATWDTDILDDILFGNELEHK